MQITGTRFGAIDFEETDVVFFSEGLIGFPHLNSFLIVPHKKESPFRWLQSLEEPALAFLSTDPWHFVPTYDPEVASSSFENLKIDENTEKVVLVTAAIPGGNAQALTLNLLAPILINIETREAKQVVLDSEAYTIKHRVFEAQPETATQAA